MRSHSIRAARWVLGILSAAWACVAAPEEAAAPSVELPMLVAHRGHFAYAENSKASVLATLDTQSYAGAEIDVQLLGDGFTWVLYHDLMSGRPLSTSRRDAIRRMTPAQWAAGKLVDTARNAAPEPPAFLEDVLRDVKARAPRDWHLMIEPKGRFKPGEVAALVTLVRRYLPPELASFTSLDTDTLQYLRDSAPRDYLGWVVLHPAVAAKGVPNEARDAVRKYGQYFDTTLDDVHYILSGGSRLSKDPDLILSAVRDIVREPMGIHLERNMLVNQPLVSSLLAAKLPLVTYSDSGSEPAYARFLGLLIREKSLPIAAAVISSDPAVFAQTMREAYASGPVLTDAPVDPRPAPVIRDETKPPGLPAPAKSKRREDVVDIDDDNHTKSVTRK